MCSVDGTEIPGLCCRVYMHIVVATRSSFAASQFVNTEAAAPC